MVEQHAHGFGEAIGALRTNMVHDLLSRLWSSWVTLGLFCLPKPASRFGPPLPPPIRFLSLSTLRPPLRCGLRFESPRNRNYRKVVTPARQVRWSTRQVR